MSTAHFQSGNTDHTFFARWIRRLAVPIILGWLALVFVLNTAIPSLEDVGKARTVSMSPTEAPSMIAMTRMGELFDEGDSDNIAMIVLEGKEPLGTEAHRYYDELLEKLRADPEHVQSFQDFWGDPLTEASAQSTDGKAAYVQMTLAGNMGETLANESVEAVRKIIDETEAPDGVTTYVTGFGALQTDMNHAGDRTMLKITITTFAVIITMLMLVYRSITTVVLLLMMVGIQLSAARGLVAALGHYEIIGLSTFAVNLLVSLAIAASTDYCIFLIGRYQEARQAGHTREDSYYITFNGTTHVILGSGLTIAGALLCLSFTRMPYFQTLGVPCAVGMLVAVAVALTLSPAVLVVGGKFGLFDPKRKLEVHGWRRVGTVIVRWPAPVLAASLGLAVVGLAALPGYKTNYDDRQYIPKDIPANEGFAAADAHFSQSRMNPEVLLLEANHDMRNSADFLVLDKIAKAVFRVPGVARVQAITRPSGTPIEHTSIPFIISMQGAGQMQNMKLLKDRMDDMLTQADEMGTTIVTMKNMYSLMTELSGVTHDMVTDMNDLQGTIHDMRDHIADFDDFFRPIRNYFYWEPHCFDIPVCHAIRSVFDTLDGIDAMTETMDAMIVNMNKMDALMPQMVSQFAPMIDTMQNMQTMMFTMHSTMSGMYAQMEELGKDSTEMGKAFDAAKNDDSFYLPPEIFDNPDFQRGLKMFLSPDGKAVRMIIAHRGDPASEEGISHVTPIIEAAIEAVKGTPLEDARISLGGTAAVFKDMSIGSKYDLLIAGISALCLIFIIMMLITRSLVAAMVIVGTVALSLGASFGLSVLIWQYIVGMELHWMVLAMSVIVLLAVGSDYNLLLVSRFKEEVHAGFNTGIIRAMGGSGKVVTAAGLVFAFTMGAMVVSDLRIIGQVGTTIALGLLFDTLIVRSFMTPSIAALLGRWFWWPMNLPTKPARARPVSTTADTVPVTTSSAPPSGG